HQRALAGFTGTRRADPCMTNTLTASSRRMAPRNAQMLTAARTSASGNCTNIKIVAKSVAMNLAREAKYVLHDVQCAGRILDAKKRPRNGMVFSWQLGHRYSFTSARPPSPSCPESPSGSDPIVCAHRHRRLIRQDLDAGSWHQT